MVEFGTTVDPAISDRVLALDDALGAAPLAGLLERVPTYRSLMLHYDPLVLDRETLAARVRSLAAGATARAATPTLWTLPCCYDAPHGEDIVQVAQRAGLSPDAVVSTHAPSASPTGRAGRGGPGRPPWPRRPDARPTRPPSTAGTPRLPPGSSPRAFDPPCDRWRGRAAGGVRGR